MKTTEEIIKEIMSNPEEQKRIVEDHKRIEMDHLYVSKNSENYKTLLKQFPEEWIAIYNRQVIAHNKDVHSLFSILHESYRGKYAVVEYITEKESRIILPIFD